MVEGKTEGSRTRTKEAEAHWQDFSKSELSTLKKLKETFCTQIKFWEG